MDSYCFDELLVFKEGPAGHGVMLSKTPSWRIRAWNNAAAACAKMVAKNKYANQVCVLRKNA
jgi:hypothetical protein